MSDNEQLAVVANELAGIPMELVYQKLSSLPQIECPLVHRFAPGAYAREMTVPSGSLIAGRSYRLPVFNVLLSGTISLLGKDGTISTITAPFVFVAGLDAKIAFAHTEVKWLNFFPTDETDVEKIEDMFTVLPEELKHIRAADLEARQIFAIPDRKDFEKFLEETGCERVEAVNRELSSSFPMGEWRIEIRPSPIHGHGLFASASIAAGEEIAPDDPAIMAYVNHSLVPNAEFVEVDERRFLRAISPISGRVGGVDGDEITVNYRSQTKVIT